MLTRRSLIGGVGVALAAPSLLRAANSGERAFRVIRDGSDIGRHVLSVRRSGDDIQVAIDIELKVKILGITAYRYEMANREVWRDGKIISMDSKSNDDGDPAFCKIARAGDKLDVEGSIWSGQVPGNSVSTTYWSYDFLKSPLWISSADGDPLKVVTSKAGAGEVQGPNGPLATEKWTVKGEMDIDLHYVDREWVGLRFDAGGEDAIYMPEDVTQNTSAVWFNS
ncbi:MAG: DUF6134 family protein [Pseudomonadota bacterium]